MRSIPLGFDPMLDTAFSPRYWDVLTKGTFLNLEIYNSHLNVDFEILCKINDLSH